MYMFKYAHIVQINFDYPTIFGQFATLLEASETTCVSIDGGSFIIQRSLGNEYVHNKLDFEVSEIVGIIIE